MALPTFRGVSCMGFTAIRSAAVARATGAYRGETRGSQPMFVPEQYREQDSNWMLDIVRSNRWRSWHLMGLQRAADRPRRTFRAFLTRRRRTTGATAHAEPFC